ncbi:MAG TPA: M48 family metallopeptidase [Sedimentisphaerales bacterium]|nr:M48 family metallopeptidase [Sedimentisphaerales bacterium]HRS10059.1 M48 family metallopeptidase [Sedimentisphaerales bacterium]HRV46765.1 M48 family metallopeptidase [Sedimentisphaerales bacterium]
MNRVVETWEIADIGPVAVAVSDRARHARITIKRDGTVTLTLPRRMSPEQARGLLQKSKRWIQTHLRQVHAEQLDPRLDRVQARRQLVDRLEYLARQHGFTYNKVFIKNQKSRWGSCSSHNNINLNVHLMRLPEELRDYVLVHELVHTRHKNHSRQFWATLNAIVGDGRKLQCQLRRYQPGP